MAEQRSLRRGRTPPSVPSTGRRSGTALADNTARPICGEPMNQCTTRQFTIADLLWLTFVVACVMGLWRAGWLFAAIEALRVVFIIIVVGFAAAYALILLLVILIPGSTAPQPKAPE